MTSSLKHERKEKTTPFGVNLMRSLVIYQAAHTVNRAGAASIYVALQECRPDHDEDIATDSKCSMDKIAKHIRDLHSK